MKGHPQEKKDDPTRKGGVEGKKDIAILFYELLKFIKGL